MIKCMFAILGKIFQDALRLRLGMEPEKKKTKCEFDTEISVTMPKNAIRVDIST